MERTMRQRPETRPLAPAARAARSAVVVLALCAAAGCDKEDKNAFVAPPPPDVVVANPVERDVTQFLTYTGVVEAAEVVELRARVQGFLEKINYQPGQVVKKGDILFVIDKSQYTAALESAKADLESAKAGIGTAEAEVAVQEALFVGAENDARLARELADQKAGPEIDAVIKAAKRDAVKADIQKAKAGVITAKTNVARAQAAIVTHELNLSYCDVTTPTDGRATVNQVDVGNLVGRNEPTLLATIVQPAPVYVSVDVNEADVLAVRREIQKTARKPGTEPGQVGPGEWRPVELALGDETEFKVKGRVEYVSPQMNEQTGTLRVRTLFANEDLSLLPGLFAKIRFPMSIRKSVLVPDAALLSDQQGRYALVVGADGTVEAKRVKIGIAEGAMRVVEEGLQTSDRVVVLGVLKARPGSKVTPLTEEEAAQKAKASNAAAQAAKDASAAALEKEGGKKDDAKKDDAAGGR
jgi:RND family efflux transporter MFP subunit